MTRVYQGLGVSCMYPENWTVSEETEGERVTGFMLESPTSAYMTVVEYPWTVPPREAVEKAREAMEQEYEETEYLEREPELKYRGERIADCRGADLHFYYLDLLVVSRLVSFTLQRKTYLVQMQAEDRDFQSLEAVFQAMLISMIRSLESSQDTIND